MMEERTASSRGRRSKVARLIDEYDLDRLGKEMARRWTAEDDRWSLRDLADHFNQSILEAAMQGEGAQLLDGEVETPESERDQLRERRRHLESAVNEIQSVIGFNQEMLEDADADVLDPHEDSPEDVTEELLPDETVTCWTCGSEVSEEQIETTIDRLQELSKVKLGDVNAIESEIDDITLKVDELREQQRHREELQRRVNEVESEIEQTESTIERIGDRRDELQSEIEDLEGEIEEMEDDAYEGILGFHKEANQLEYGLGRLEGDFEDFVDEIDEIESSLNGESEIEARREELDTEIEELRTKIDRIESQATEEFKEHMESVLEILQYSNIERIWLECVERDVREGRRKVTKSIFELHIVRETDSGATNEDTIDHLSESEREVTGLVFALARY